MSIQGRFCVILFFSMRLGTQDEDTELLTFTSKTMPPGSGYDYDDVETEPTVVFPAMCGNGKGY